jgi:hypothetical protein
MTESTSHTSDGNQSHSTVVETLPHANVCNAKWAVIGKVVDCLVQPLWIADTPVLLVFSAGPGKPEDRREYRVESACVTRTGPVEWSVNQAVIDLYSWIPWFGY